MQAQPHYDNRAAGIDVSRINLLENKALFLDIDGTILELAPAPDEVDVTPRISALLDRLYRQLGGAVALVSGRSLDSIDHLFHDFRGAVVGLHGVEIRLSDGVVTRSIPAGFANHPAAKKKLQDLVRGHSGLLLEDKGLSIALHYRRRPDLADLAYDYMQSVLESVHQGFHLLQGNMVYELKPANANKGKAILGLMQHEPFRGRTPVFLGDDTTDEYAFKAVNTQSGFSIRVGTTGPGMSRARYRLPNVKATISWLESSCIGDLALQQG